MTTPDPKGRGDGSVPPARTRLGVAAGLVGLTTALFLGLASARTGPAASVGRLPPTPLVDRTGAPARLPTPGRPSTLLYVDQRCPACRALIGELDRGTARGRPPFTVVLSPGSSRAWIDSLPRPVRPRAVHDVFGLVAESLGIRRVPTAVELSPNAAVRSRTVGRLPVSPTPR